MKLLSRQGKCYSCGALGHRANECPRPKRQQRGTDKRESQNPRVAQVLEVPDDRERESVSRIVAATVREILGDPDASASVRTLAISDGVLGVTIAAQQACDNGTWILADTGATHEPVSVRKDRRFQQVLDHVSCSWQLVMWMDGQVMMVWFILNRKLICLVFFQSAELSLSAI